VEEQRADEGEQEEAPQALRANLLFAVPMLLVVGGILFGVNSWLDGGGVGGEEGRADGPHRDRGPDRDRGPPPEEPEQIGFHPEPGSYLFEVWVSGESLRRTGLDIRKLDAESYRITGVYRPPEPFLEPIPEALTAHLGHIRMRIDIGSGGHILDVTGPDDYFDTLEDEQQGSSEPVRQLLLEEQVDAHYRWQVTATVSQLPLPDRSWTSEASFRGFGEGSGWSGVLRYSTSQAEDCGPASPQEQCIPIEVSTDQSSDSSSVSGTLWVGTKTGLQWASELTLRRKGTTRTIETRLVRR
jgi:hypothetical protein